MKTSFFSLFAILCLVYCIARTSNAAATCGTVDSKASSCIAYASGKAATPAPACCTGLQQLAATVKTVDDRKAICRCLKAAVKNFAAVQDKFLSKIPSVCKINVNFPVSLNTDCEKIH
ncbi:hypothetical protein ACS0TY_019107 [Phlomoides rotata]